MAEMDMELDSDYKFPLRRWLIRKIDRGEIRNLKWLDMPLRTLFKIPWNRQGHPDWEQEYKIFKDWAIHRGKNVEETDWTKMKANFRSVLNKSNDFEEVKDQRVEDQQTGNYRVYRLLTHVQVKEKTKRANQRKKIFKKSSSPLSKQCDILPSSCSSSSPQECTPNVAASILPECSQWSTNQSQDFAKNTIRSQSTYHLEISDTALPDENRSILLNQGPSRTMQSTQMPSGMSGQCQIYPDFSQLKETHYRQPSPPMQTPSFFEDSEEDMFLTAPLPNQKQKEKTKRANQRKKIFKKSSSPLSKQCDILPSSCSSSSPQECTPMETELLRDVVMAEDTSRTLVPGESIFSYQASIQYNDQVVKEEVFPDLRQPYRIHYGSDEDQTLEALVKQDSLPPFLKQQAWPLPPQPERDSDKYVQTILNECDLGVVVRSDENGNIFAERLCKARIYVYEQELSSNDIIKLERREETQIFSHQVFKKELKKFREKEKTMAIPEGKVKIFFATVPHSRDSKGVVSLTLTSCVAAKIARNEVGILPQVEVSLSNSLDYLIKSTDLIQIANNKR